MNTVLGTSVVAAIFLIFDSANAQQLDGKFTHDYTKLKNDVVWTVTKSEGKWKVFVHGSKEQFPAQKATQFEREIFWKSMSWPITHAKDAECLWIQSQPQAALCYLSATKKKQVPSLQTQVSDYFYFDSMGGVMEISPVRSKPRT